MTKRILVIEDEKGIRELLLMTLELQGYDVRAAETGLEAIALVANFSPDLILLDRMLPDLDGMSICEMLRKNEATHDVPIIVLSALGEEEDIIRGLSAGADDYVTKPFRIHELQARIQSLLRRAVERPKITTEATRMGGIIQHEDLVLDPDAFTCTAADRSIELTRSEFLILFHMMRHQNRVSTREELFRAINSNYDSELQSQDLRTIDVHIRNLRRKIETDRAYIRTIRGIGYRIG